MTQKLTQVIQESTVTRGNALSPILTKRQRLGHIWRANAKKAWESRKRKKLALARQAEQEGRETGEKAA